ncbi:MULTISPECIES: SMODS domain-containing nucleotidyltransferase [unclassified Rhizobium]|uniref:SMODS domain-containing nucleotidyltransferase n=1 Tax=unclassified Rhizobium TaxID=2613769 RepID=UPI00177B4863|nr:MULTISPECIES: hypothetical protein [unclassified Rhizobium]MBD8687186.1 hypothetical protein [Rhizobium sp. CFBP 13644]MBD8691011.1 hypothetical protein [Rhizobium sp. CFBP 13717]
MELKSQFDAFLREIRPTDRQKEDWRTGSNTLRSRLAEDKELSPNVVATFLQGSVRRSTAIRPTGDKRPDVDVVVVTDIDYHKTTPQQAMDKFIPFLERHYPGKWRPQGRSFGIEMSYVDIDLVITALPTDPASRQAMERLYRSNSVLTTSTLEDDMTWRLNERWQPTPFGRQPLQLDDEPSGNWRPNPLFLPDRDAGDWGRTHPLSQIQWTAAKNRACNGHYVKLVRATKWWRQQNVSSLPNYPKGYPLEHMIGHVLNDGTASMASGFVQIMETMRETWRYNAALGSVPVLADHGVPEHNVLKRLSVEDFQSFYAAISTTADRAREALESDDAHKSGKLWQKLFGAKFPLPGPNGGDRKAGFFVQPTQPAEPRRTDRFA